MKRYLVIALLIVAAVAGINFVVDPAGLASTSREQAIADILLSGKNAAVPRSHIEFEERRLLSNLANSDRLRPRTIAFGSSRFRYASAEFYDDPDFFNHSINAATLEDLFTLYFYYRRRGALPERMIISLDPWMIDNGVSYIGLINLAYPWDFIAASRNLGLKLTENDRAVILEGLDDKPADLRDFAIYSRDERLAQEIDPPGTAEYLPFRSVTIDRIAQAYLTFEARILPGTYYYALSITDDADEPLLEGGYLGPLDDGQEASVHEFRRFRTPVMSVTPGETLSLNLVSADGNMEPVGGNGQALQVEESCSARKVFGGY